MSIVIRDAAGAIINIGPWDYLEGEEEYHDEEGVQHVKTVCHNPLPDGAYEDDVEIVEGWDGGLYASDDPRRLGKV